MRIVIAEDEKITRQWVKSQIEKLHPEYYIVGTFANGRQALDYMESHETDVLFTDIRMPVMDGLELLGELQRRENRSYKVILSAYDEFHYAQQALRLGANEFTLKPEITREELGRILEEAGAWLEKQSREREIPENLQEQKEIWMRRILSGRGGEQTGREKQVGEGMRERGIDLDDRDLRAICISFPCSVPREKVMELLQLYFSDETIKYFCLQLGVQSFGVFFNQIKQGTCEEFGGRLGELLQIHIGTDVYMGLSDVGNGYDQLMELCRQGMAAKENRQFFGISGCLLYEDLRTVPYFGDTVREILDALEARDFEDAKRKTAAFFAEAGKAHDLQPACIVAPGREILTGYMRRLREYTLSEEEYGRLRQCELLPGRPAFYFRQFREEILDAIDFLSDALEQKERYRSCSPAVQKIMRYVEEHYGERISLEQVASAAFLSRSYASVLFKKETGEKFSDYLQRIRIEKSCGLLKNTSLSIQETADRTGFFDTAHFSRVFKERMGISPIEYRKNR